MPFTVRADDERRAVIVTVTGEVDGALTKAMVIEARALANPKRFDLLYDFRGAWPKDIHNADLFWFARNLPVASEPATWRLRVAALHMPAQREFMHFWETAFTNVGLTARAFEDEDAAFEWLGERSRPGKAG